MNDSGRMHLDIVLRFLKYLPHGVTEIYFHPATSHPPADHSTMEDGRYQDEFEALTSPVIQQALLASNIQRTSFSDL